MNKEEQRQLEREKLLLRYTIALEHGDLDTVAAILQAAEEDAELEQMILEINDLEAAQMEEAAYTRDAATVRALVQSHLLSAWPESTPEPPPLTVGNVIARIHADAAALRVRVEREALAATRAHQSVDTPLPTDLSLRAVSQLLERVGVKVSGRFQEIFRQTALFMRMGRNQGMARLAATRQQQSHNKPYVQFNSKPPQAPAHRADRTLREDKSGEYSATENRLTEDKPTQDNTTADDTTADDTTADDTTENKSVNDTPTDEEAP